jgi:hypothetical protein
VQRRTQNYCQPNKGPRDPSLSNSEITFFSMRMLLLMGIAYGLTLSSCRGDLEPVSLSDYTFYIQNNSTDTFKYSYSTLFPDTSILNNMDSSFLIYPFRQNQVIFPQYLLPDFKTNGLVEIFLFNVDTIRKYGWPTVASKYLITKRYDLTYDSLIENNNIINYP